MNLANLRHEPAPGMVRRPLVAGPVALPMSPQTVFVSLDTARAALGVDAENIKHRVESGELQWVFNLGTSQTRQDLRFWLIELASRETTVDMSLPEVIREVLGGARRISRGQLERRWVVSHITVMRWIQKHQIELSKSGWVCCISLEKFLTARWIRTQQENERDIAP